MGLLFTSALEVKEGEQPLADDFFLQGDEDEDAEGEGVGDDEDEDEE